MNKPSNFFKLEARKIHFWKEERKEDGDLGACLRKIFKDHVL